MQLFKIKTETKNDIKRKLLRLLISVLVAGVISFLMSFIPSTDPISAKAIADHPFIFWGAMMIGATFLFYVGIRE